MSGVPEQIEALELAIYLLRQEAEGWKSDKEIVLRNLRIMQLEYAISQLQELIKNKS